MRLCFNIELPDSDIRVGGWDRDVDLRSIVDEGLYLPPLRMEDRSLVGYEGRQYRRFYPVINCLETLVQNNEWQFARYALAGSPLPRLYESGVRYQAEPPGEEEWLDYPHLLKVGKGDCEDCAGARTAELRFRDHIAAVPCIKYREFYTPKGRLTLVHVMTLHPNGYIEDPSKLLGMGGEYT